jgi:hypothetical protein
MNLEYQFENPTPDLEHYLNLEYQFENPTPDLEHYPGYKPNASFASFTICANLLRLFSFCLSLLLIVRSLTFLSCLCMAFSHELSRIAIFLVQAVAMPGQLG